MDDKALVDFWFERHPLDHDGRNPADFLTAEQEEEAVDGLLDSPVGRRQMCVAKMVHGAAGISGMGGRGIFAFPFLRRLFEKSDDRNLRYFILSKVAIHFVVLDGKFNQEVYDWLCWAVEELDCRKVAEMMDVIRSRFDDLCDVLDFSAPQSPEISKARQ